MSATVTGQLRARLACHRQLVEHYNHREPAKAAVELDRFMRVLTTLRAIEEARYWPAADEVPDPVRDGG